MGAETDEVFSVLASGCRRRTLQYLRRTTAESVPIAALVDHLTGIDHPSTGSPDDHRELFEAELRHIHLPKLADLGLIDYDPDSGRVSYLADERVERLLDASLSLPA